MGKCDNLQLMIWICFDMQYDLSEKAYAYKKSIYSIVFLLLLITSCTEQPQNRAAISSQPLLPPYQLFNNDSGFIIKREGDELIKIISIDSLSPMWDKQLPDDTIGKYYKVSETGHVVVCLEDLEEEEWGRAHLLIELSKDSIITQQHFGHYNYPCCWENSFDGFKRINNTFYFRSCNTGSGYCAGNLYLFDKLISQDSLNTIIESVFSSYKDEFQKLSSTMEIVEKIVRMHYVLELNVQHQKAKHTKYRKQQFTVNYILSGHSWVADDSTHLKEVVY